MEDWFLTSWPEPLAQALLFVLIVAALGLILLAIGESLPRSRFDHGGKWFRVRPWEKDGLIYERLRIRKWKDRVPDNSKIFPWIFKKKIARYHDPAYTLRLLQETCVAEVVHWALAALSPAFGFLMNRPWGWILCALYALGNLPFIMIQRYNRHRLTKIYIMQTRGKGAGA